MNKLLTAEDFVEVGFIAGLSGFNGQCKLGLSEDVEDYFLSEIKHFYCIQSGMYVPYFIENIAEKAGQWLLKMESINDRETAVDMTNQPIYIRKDQLPNDLLATIEQSILLQTAVNFSIFDINADSIIGQIIEINEYPSGPIATLQLQDKEDTTLIPLVESFIVDILKEEKILKMDLPDGLIP
ncbi:ribosome maturation factor RimM [Membranihabitans marinus]|uniref:ribosome maturation factor RimM n=1 Tax=Membranihabitans marinus TaxID=1227546 RepID=UPI001F2E17BA|nr:hypothetical protein [Membranihabitans marinus]